MEILLCLLHSNWMKQSKATTVGLFLAGCAIFLGQITSAVARSSRGGEGGVADSSNDCSSAPNASVGSNPFNTTGATVNLSFTGSPCGNFSIYNCKFFNQDLRLVRTVCCAAAAGTSAPTTAARRCAATSRPTASATSTLSVSRGLLKKSPRPSTRMSFHFYF